MTHRPSRDGTPVATTHVPYYLALEVMSDAWAIAIFTACDGVMQPNELGVVHVTCDFGRELFVGEATVDVSLQSLGTSSMTLSLTLSQHGHQAAAMTAVLARVDPLRLTSVPLTPAQRTALETLTST
jgi:acyl-CoA thioesterase FadM